MGKVTLLNFFRCLAYLVYYLGELVFELLLLIISHLIARAAVIGLVTRVSTAIFLIGLLLLIWFPIESPLAPALRQIESPSYDPIEEQLFTEPAPVLGPDYVETITKTTPNVHLNDKLPVIKIRLAGADAEDDIVVQDEPLNENSAAITKLKSVGWGLTMSKTSDDKMKISVIAPESDENADSQEQPELVHLNSEENSAPDPPVTIPPTISVTFNEPLASAPPEETKINSCSEQVLNNIPINRSEIRENLAGKSKPVKKSALKYNRKGQNSGKKNPGGSLGNSKTSEPSELIFVTNPATTVEEENEKNETCEALTDDELQYVEKLVRVINSNVSEK